MLGQEMLMVKHFGCTYNLWVWNSLEQFESSREIWRTLSELFWSKLLSKVLARNDPQVMNKLWIIIRTVRTVSIDTTDRSSSDLHYGVQYEMQLDGDRPAGYTRPVEL